MIAVGIPTAYIFEIISPLGRNPLNLKLISLLTFKFRIIQRVIARVSPITVARAAPVTSILGKTKKPNILNGSSIIFTIAQKACDIMEMKDIPVA